MKNEKRTTPEEYVIGILMALLFFTAIFQVFNRFIFHISAAWTEELCRYSFIWLAFLGIANGVRRGTHLSVDLIDSFLSDKAKRVLQLLIDICFFLLMCYVCKISVDYVIKIAGFGTKSIGLGIKMWIVYLILPVFSISTAIRLLMKNVSNFIGKNRVEKEEDR